MEYLAQNPFAVQTPEHLSADNVVSLFVSEFTDYWQIPNKGHTLIYGPRGAGKSMIFRFMEPDCQVKSNNSTFKDLNYYAAYIPIKETELNLSEFFQLEEARYAPLVLNEHLMVANVACKLFKSLLVRAPLEMITDPEAEALRDFYTTFLSSLLLRAGWENELPQLKVNSSPQETIETIASVFDDIYAEGNAYLRRLAFTEAPKTYNGALFGYMDFLAPLAERLVSLPFMPNGPIYLLVDDADNLNESQTLVLNSWVASRTTGYLCLKISTQTLDYKTYKTPNGKRIDAPHDFSEVHICDIYTTRKDTYRRRVHKIVERRLAIYNIVATPEAFFPEDEEQEQKISAIADKLKSDFFVSGRGAKPSDDALRYARPNFIKDLAGVRKSSSTYSYAGFNQLVHISSGVVRHFLDAASLMFGQAQSQYQAGDVKSIPPAIQNKTVRDMAENLLFSNFTTIERDEAKTDEGRDNVRKLRNLIFALGGMYYQILVSEAAERRVFSIAFTDGPSDDVLEILNLGVKYGYLHQSSIGNKEGTGRVPLYIMSRRLAPAFKLDPTSFAGYKFVRNAAVIEAIHRPKVLLNRVKIKGFDEVMEATAQGELFE